MADPAKGKEVSPAAEFWLQHHLVMECNKTEKKTMKKNQEISPIFSELQEFPFLLLNPELEGWFLFDFSVYEA